MGLHVEEWDGYVSPSASLTLIGSKDSSASGSTLCSRFAPADVVADANALLRLRDIKI